MDCRTISERHLADEYLAGRLSPAEAEAFERHYFECDACEADLRLREQVAHQLRQEGAALFPAEQAAEEAGRLRLSPEEGDAPGWRERLFAARLSWGWGVAAVAAVLAVALLSPRQTSWTGDTTAIWQPRAHPYVAAELRGASPPAEFRQGMDLYVQGRYAEAARLLERVARQDPRDAEARFYLGVSELLAGRPAAAAKALREAVAIAPDSRLDRWYLAQALVGAGRLDEAEALLRPLAGSPGEWAREADDLLGRIAARRGK